jgi:hypothetical protein
MKTFKLTLSDSASHRAFELASGHGIPVESYLSSEMEDLLDAKSDSLKTPVINESSITVGTPKPPPAPSSSTEMKVTLEQVLDVCKYVYRTGNVPNDERHAKAEFSAAISTVAANAINTQTGLKGVSETTVRDKCTTDRRLGLPGVHVDTRTFLAWLCRPELLRDHLCRKFPGSIDEVRRRFAEWLPKRFGGH